MMLLRGEWDVAAVAGVLKSRQVMQCQYTHSPFTSAGGLGRVLLFLPEESALHTYTLPL